MKLEAKQERKRRFTLLVSLIIGVTVVLAIFQLVLSNRLASYGGELAKLRTQEKEFTESNMLLTKEIAKAGSLETIAQKAQNLSMTSATAFLVVEKAESVALLR